MNLRTFIVSLLDQSKRRALATDQANKYGLEFEFFDAVDGKRLEKEVLHAHYDEARNRKYFKRPLANGEIACYLSHIGLWEKIAHGTDDRVLILEDDFEFIVDPTPFFRQLADKNIADVMIKIDGSPRQRKPRIVEDLGETTLSMVDIIPARTTGYLIGRKAAERLYESRRNFFRTVDNDIKHHWEYDVPVLVAIPQLVRERDDNKSNLDEARNAQRSGGVLKRLLNNLLYQARFKIGLLIHPKTKIDRIRELLSA
ncbi:MAG: glycosyltransferase family 25 protein [Paracoccaceae bacterium]